MEVRLAAKRAWEAGESYNAVAAELNVAVSSIKSWRARDKWTRKPEADLAIVPESSDVEIPDDLSEQAAQYEEDMRVTALKFSNHVKNLPPDQIAAKADRIKSLDVVNRKALRIETEKPPVAIQIAVLASSPAKRDQALHSAIRPRRISSE
jgi:hypothetical protein